MRDLARRLDPCVNWFRLLARTKGRILWVFPAALALAFLWVTPWGDVVWNFNSNALPKADAALVAEARRLNLSYETVAANPRAHAGRPVIWCLSQDEGRTYVDGRTGWLVEIAGPVPKAASWRGSRCLSIVAVIEESSAPNVRLSWAGRP